MSNRGLAKPVRWTTEEIEEIEKAAKEVGLSFSAFIRSCALKEAKKINKPK